MDTILAFIDICNVTRETPLTIFLALVEFEGDQTTDVEFIGFGLTAVGARDWFNWPAFPIFIMHNTRYEQSWQNNVEINLKR